MFHTYIYNPIFQTLLFIYSKFSFGDLGIAIVLLTIFIRVVLFPLFYKGAKDQAVMQKIQPEIKEIQKKHKGDVETQGKALMELYKKNKLNPFSSILFLLVQLPIFFALFKMFQTDALGAQFDNPFLFGLINLKEKGIDFALLAAILQFFQMKISIPKGNQETMKVQKIMLYFAPILTCIILISLPRALALYWIVTTVFSIAQQWYINKKVAN